MSSNKSQKKKAALAKKIRQNRRIPIFVMAKTARRVTRNSESRNWRRKKLKVKDE
jgi:large subunit ribosomal protein L39e